MAMIKRGHSDKISPTVVTASKRCPSCGHLDETAVLCPKCNTSMVSVVVDNQPEDTSCPNGVCSVRGIHKI